MEELSTRHRCNRDPEATNQHGPHKGQQEDRARFGYTILLGMTLFIEIKQVGTQRIDVETHQPQYRVHF